MSQKEIKSLIDLAKRKLKESKTKDEALASLVSAGILDKKGQFAKPYSHLKTVVLDAQS